MCARGKRLLPAVVTIVVGGSAMAAAAVAPRVAGPKGDGTGVTPNGWTLTPAGRQVGLGERPYGSALSPDGRTLLVSNDGQSTQSLSVVDATTGEVRQTIPYERPESLFLGVSFSPDGTRAYASAGGNDKVRVYDVAGQRLDERPSIPVATGQPPAGANPYPAGLAASLDGRSLYVALNLANALGIVDLASATVTATVPVGPNPAQVALSGDGRTAYVSNWGGNTVSVVDTQALALTATVTVGTHPNALLRHPNRAELYVANADSDTVSVVDTAALRVARTIDLSPYPGSEEGSRPNALALSPDGSTLYVANAGNNDVAVVRLADPRRIRSRDEVVGMVPTAWYPTTVTATPDGGRLLVTNAKGLGAGPNPGGPHPYRATTPPEQYVGSMIKGTLSVVAVPDRATLRRYTRQVVANNGFDERDRVRTAGAPRQRVVPRRVGDPSPIEHVVYVVKENRTYDQVYGGLGRGDGDPSLELFGEESAPNHRELARRFVTLDNFYADAEVSADGWNWSTAAYANTYVQKNWPASYGGRARPYDFEGGNPATAPSEDPQNAYLWAALDTEGLSYRNYGFWASGTVPAVVAPTEPNLAAKTDPAFPGYNLAVKDQVRADEWLQEFRGYEARGDLPAVQMVRLPNDHTAGTRAGFPTPRAVVADDDLALGRLVDAVSHSKYWNSTAIFVVEDDAQNGPDHVDAHRTVALVVSPYTQRGGVVDSTLYSTVSMLRTMELILGVAPLTQFDAPATPMLAAFVDRPDARPYDAVVPRQPLDETNTPASPMAGVAARLDLLAGEDRADERLLNEAVWRSVKGTASPMPEPRGGSRAEDEEAEEAEEAEGGG